MSVPPPADPTPSTPGVPAGWYPDAASGRTRWWNGTAWTDDYAPGPQSPTAVGYAVYGGYAPRPAGNGLAVAALVLGLVSILLAAATFVVFGRFGSIFTLLFVGAPVILAIVFGAVGVARSGAVGQGRALALTGLILGVVAVLLVALGWFRY